MRRTAIQLLQQVNDEPATVTELADALDKNQGWISELASNLEEQHLVERNQCIELGSAYEARLLKQLLDIYDLEPLLTGVREDILQALLEPKTVSELETQGFAKSTVYDALTDFKSAGVITETNGGKYRVVSDTLRSFLEARTLSNMEGLAEYTTGDETLVVADPDSDIEGEGTAFSAFQRYGIEYYPAKQYLHRGPELEIEDVLMHAVTVAENRKQMAMTAVFYLTHTTILDSNELWRLARKWECIERWADLLAYIDRRDVKDDSLFLPWEEFTQLANDYGVYPRGKHPEDSLQKGFKELGEALETNVAVYLLGGGNLILRELKDSTKDIDVVVTDSNDFYTLVETLQKLGYEERQDLETVYKKMNPSIILEKQGFPRWDIFVEEVAGNLRLTDEMKDRCDHTAEYENLSVHLLSLTDIFLFKSITDREGDLEDIALIAEQAELDWQAILVETQRQEELTDQLFSFAVLDSLDLLKQRYDIAPPIHQRLVSYCLEHALLLSLTEPKTIEDLRDELDFPDHQIYNKLRKLENQHQIKVDRTRKLNKYMRVDSAD